MKKAFSQNGRRNIAVVVDLLFLRKPMLTLCAISIVASLYDWQYIAKNIKGKCFYINNSF